MLKILKRFEQGLELWSFIYLSIPLIIFFIGFLNPIIYLIFIVLFIICAKNFILEFRVNDKESIVNYFNKTKLYGIIVLLIIWVFLSGSGDFAYQNEDYVKHNAILFDLISQSWPVIFEIKTQDGQENVFSLIYYIAYYLPAALIGKIFSLKIAIYFIFLWTFIGVLISFLWLSKILNKINLYILIFFIFFAGFDYFGYVVNKIGIESFFLSFINAFKSDFMPHVSWWSTFTYKEKLYFLWQFSSNTNLLFWVPQHAISGWITGGIFINFILNQEKKISNLIIWIALSFFWSPFVTISLAIYFIYYLINFFNFKNFKTENLNISYILFSLYVIIILILFYLSRIEKNEISFIWNLVPFNILFSKLLIFYIFQIGIFVILVYPLISFKKYSRLIIFTLLFLITIPLIKFGMYNDFCMRVSIVPLFFLLVLTLKSFEYFSFKKYTIFILIFFMMLGPLQEGKRSISHLIYMARSGENIFETRPTKTSIINIDNKLVSNQYMGKSTSFFFKYVAKENHSRN